VWLDDERNGVAAESVCEFLKLYSVQHKSKVGHGHLVSVDRIVEVLASVVVPDIVTHDLMTLEAVVLPLISASSSLGEPHHTSVELASEGNAVHWDGEVEGATAFGGHADIAIQSVTQLLSQSVLAGRDDDGAIITPHQPGSRGASLLGGGRIYRIPFTTYRIRSSRTPPYAETS
jgi:hypothetical protein